MEHNRGAVEWEVNLHRMYLLNGGLLVDGEIKEGWSRSFSHPGEWDLSLSAYPFDGLAWEDACKGGEDAHSRRGLMCPFKFSRWQGTDPDGFTMVF